jgi:hypothetical protein
MRYSIPISLLLVILSIPMSAQLRFDAMEKDYGLMRPLEYKSLDFRVYNDSPVAVHLAAPRPSCGCTATILERAELAPGDSTVIGVRFHAAPGMMGPMSKTIAIGLLEGGAERTVATLRIHARVIGDVIYEPGMLRFTGVIGDTVRLPLSLRSNTSKTVRLDNISTALLAYVDTSEGNTYHVENIQTRPFTSFDVSVANKEIAAGDSTELILVIVPEEKGQINGTIRIPIPDGELRVPVSGVVLRTRAP